MLSNIIIHIYLLIAVLISTYINNIFFIFSTLADKLHPISSHRQHSSKSTIRLLEQLYWKIPDDLHILHLAVRLLEQHIIFNWDSPKTRSRRDTLTASPPYILTLLSTQPTTRSLQTSSHFISITNFRSRDPYHQPLRCQPFTIQTQRRTKLATIRSAQPNQQTFHHLNIQSTWSNIPCISGLTSSNRYIQLPYNKYPTANTIIYTFSIYYIVYTLLYIPRKSAYFINSPF